MTVTAHALGNVVYEESLLNAVDKVKNGQQLSHVLEEDGYTHPVCPKCSPSVKRQDKQTLYL